MSLRDRLRSKKTTKKQTEIAEPVLETKTNQETTEFSISINKVTKAVNGMKNTSDLGKIVKEFSKFLSTLASDDAKITFSGSFDLGQKMLLNCILSSFLEDENTLPVVEDAVVAPKKIAKRAAKTGVVESSPEDFAAEEEASAAQVKEEAEVVSPESVEEPAPKMIRRRRGLKAAFEAKETSQD